MDVRISVRHDAFDDDVKEYAHRKLEGLSRYFKGTRYLEVILDGDATSKSVEIKAHLTKGAPMLASGRHEEPTAAIDIAGGKLERMLHRLKEKLEDRRHGRGHEPPPAAAPEVPSEDITGDFVPDLNG